MRKHPKESDTPEAGNDTSVETPQADAPATNPEGPVETTIGPWLFTVSPTESPEHADLSITQEGEQKRPSAIGLDPGFDVYWPIAKDEDAAKLPASWVSRTVIGWIMDAARLVSPEEVEA
ncbi:hypothetical protein EON81_07940 [bacterium]|nr:MAG: hypothetical protein EON81_07940 [bacterium]